MAWVVPLAASALVPTAHDTAICNQFGTWQGPVNANQNPIAGLGVSVAASVTYGPSAISIASPSIASGVTVGNIYGLTIAAQKGAGVTNGYCIYQVGASDLNYFAGRVGVGVTTPGATVEFANGGYTGVTSMYLSGSAPNFYLGNQSGVVPNGGAGQQVAGVFALATAAGHFGVSEGDLFTFTQSFQSGNSNAIRFGVPTDDIGGYAVAMSIIRGGTVVIGGEILAGALFMKPSSGSAQFIMQDSVPTSTARLTLSTTLLSLSDNALPVVLNANTNGGNVNQLFLATNGNVGIGTSAPTISGTGKLHAAGNTARAFDTTRTPATSSDTANAGEMFFDASFLYVAVAANTIKRIALTSF